MLGPFTSKLIWSFEQLQNTRYDLIKRDMQAGGMGVSLGDVNADFLKRTLPVACKYWAAADLSGTKHLGESLLAEITPDMLGDAADAKIDSIQSLLRKELEERLFFYVPKERAAFYDNEDLCGLSVAFKFPNAVHDIVEAGNCYALDRPTACVFHLMRVLPYGMEELAKKLGVNYATDITALDWNGIIQPLEKAIRAIQQSAQRSAEKMEDMKHYSEIVQHLYFCKDAWRNHISHGREPYDLPKAKSVLDHTSLIMNLLAERM